MPGLELHVLKHLAPDEEESVNTESLVLLEVLIVLILSLCYHSSPSLQEQSQEQLGSGLQGLAFSSQCCLDLDSAL